MITFLLTLMLAPAHAVTTRFCVEADLAMADAAAGDRFTSAAVNYPVRGVNLTVTDVGLNATFWTGNADEGGAYAGCTPQLNLTSGHIYRLTAASHGSVSGNTLSVVADATRIEATTVALTHTAFTAGTVTAVVDGAADHRWNVYTIGAEALFWHDGSMNKSYTWRADAAVNYGSDVEIQIANWDKKFVIAHETGHRVARYRDEDTKPNVSDEAPEQDCNGGLGKKNDDDNPNSHGELTKEYQSEAAKEGFADFYAAMTWNELVAGDCDFARHYELDWNLDGLVDDGANDSHPCAGDPFDPFSGPDWIDGHDWLEDATDHLGTCTGTLANRGTQYDWMRYFWEMATTYAVPVSTIYDVWDAANPKDWSADDADVPNLPTLRMITATGTFGVQAQHFAADENGLDH